MGSQQGILIQNKYRVLFENWKNIKFKRNARYNLQKGISGHALLRVDDRHDTDQVHIHIYNKKSKSN